MEAVVNHSYLEIDRAIPCSLLQSDRFAGRVRRDEHNNAVFRHFDAQGLCGFEIKNKRGFTGFASGGSKGLWFSRTGAEDNRLIFCESAIDALSHAALQPDHQARYASIGGKPNPMQPELISAAIMRMRSGSEVVAAMDADADGAKLAAVVREAFERTGRTDVRFSIHEPFGYKDFNDQLRGKSACSLPTARRLVSLDVA